MRLLVIIVSFASTTFFGIIARITDYLELSRDWSNSIWFLCGIMAMACTLIILDKIKSNPQEDKG